MTQTDALAEALLNLFSNPEAGWFTPLSISIQELHAEQAAKIPAERFNSIWGVVNHLRYWQEYTLIRLQGASVDRETLGSKDGWPSPPRKSTERAWKLDQERMFSVYKKLADFTRTLSDDDLLQPIAEGKPSPYQVVQGVIAHNAYLSCEVISIRHMLGLWLDRT